MSRISRPCGPSNKTRATAAGRASGASTTWGRWFRNARRTVARLITRDVSPATAQSPPPRGRPASRPRRGRARGRPRRLEPARSSHRRAARSTHTCPRPHPIRHGPARPARFRGRALRLGAGLGLGLAAVLTRSPLLLAVTQGVQPLGTLFQNLLSMVVIPLVATALFAGIAGLGDLRRVGRLGVRTLGFFWGTTLAAILIGFVVAALLLPLAPITPKQEAALRQAAATDSGAVRHAAEQITTGARVIVELIPSNPVRAAVDANLLPLIVFITIFAVAAAALPDEKRRALTDLADVCTQALIRIVEWVLLLAPIGILALVAGAVAQFGWQLVQTMAVFVLAVIVGLAIFIVAVYLPAVSLVARVGLSRFLRASWPSMAMAFSTTSSLATLPTML